jgi:hypothetical protein
MFAISLISLFTSEVAYRRRTPVFEVYVKPEVIKDIEMIKPASLSSIDTIVIQVNNGNYK